MSESLSFYNSVKLSIDSGRSEDATLSTAEKLLKVKDGAELLENLSEYAYKTHKVSLGGKLYELSREAHKNRERVKDFYSRVESKPKSINNEILWNKKESVEELVVQNRSLSSYPKPSLISIYRNLYIEVWNSLMDEEENRLLLEHNKDNIWKIREYCISKVDRIFLSLSHKKASDISNLDKIYWEDNLIKISGNNRNGNYITLFLDGGFKTIQLDSEVKVIVLS
jgi:hypothetical protein